MSTAAHAGSVRERLHAAAPFGVGALVAFSAAAVGAGLGRSLVTTYLPVLLERIRDAPGLIGTVMLVNTIAGFAVPLVVGVWSDRLRDHRHGRTLPFVLGGSLLTAGGLVAIALGHASSYLALALFAAVSYTGLNAVTTAHRALIPENFDETERGAATGGEELAMLLGGLLGVVIGGLLIEQAGWAPFALGAALIPLLAVPTVNRMRGRERPPRPHPRERLGLRYYWHAARRPGGRLILAAQGLWVLGYIGLPPFFILYAKHELDLATSTAAVLLAGLGIATGIAMIGAGAAPPRMRQPLLVIAAAAMGGGLLAIAASGSLGAVVLALLPVAAGFGVLTTLGFSAYADYIPPGEEGAYSALYFSVRSMASAIAVPAAGWTIAITGSYRALFVFGGVMTLAALIPLARLLPGRVPPVARRAALAGAGLAGLAAATLAFGLTVHHTFLFEIDKQAVDLIHGFGSTPRLVDDLLVDPHIQNYTVLSLVTAAVVWSMSRAAVRAALLMAASALASYAVVIADWALWERSRPQEVLATVPANGHDWSDYPSFPSGHVAVTTALVVVAATLVPRLRAVLVAYAAVIAFTRISYGAHFPSDVAAGVVVGVLSGWAVLWVAGERRAPHVDIPWLPPLDDALRGRMRRLARWIGIVSTAGFAALLVSAGAPAAPEGGVLDAALAEQLQIALLVFAGLCVVGAWWRELFGAPLLVAGAALGVFAALEYTPSFALFSALAFAVPGALFLFAWPRVRTRLGIGLVSAFVAVVMVAGGVAAYDVHDLAYGPATPQSDRTAPPTWRVSWAWSGGVTTDSATVNARVTDDDARVRLVVARDRDLLIPVATSEYSDPDENGLTSMRVTGLDANTPYHYAVEVDGRIDPHRLGTFRTFPRGAASFTFATAGCARVGSNAEVFETIRRSDPLFFLSLGDFFYGNVSENSRPRVLDQWRRALTAPAQGALFRSVPVAYIWDDHDFGGDGSDSTVAARPAARWAHDAIVPHYPQPSAAIYQAFDVGRVRFLLLDTRSERSPDSQRDDAGKTMLGARQKEWLKRELVAARDSYKLTVVVSSVPWISEKTEGGDDWGGFATERAELSRFIADSAIDNMLMLAGDAHMFAIDDGSHTDYSGTGQARFPLMHAGALDRPGHAKGGPYSEGAYPGAGQYGEVSVRDDGSDTVEVTLSGHEYDGAEIRSLTFRTKP